MILRLLGLAVWAAVSWGFGLRLLRLLRVPPCGTAARGSMAVALALGTDVIAGLVFGWTGILGRTTTLLLVALQAAVAAASWREMRDALRLLPRIPRVMWLLVPLMALTLVSALAPYASYDARNEHFPLSKVPARSGQLQMDDELRYSANGGLHALYMLAFTVGKEEEANLVWFLFVALLPLAAYAAAREIFSPRAGVYAAFLAALYPYPDATCVAMMEKPPAFFLMLGILAAARFRSEGSWPWAVLAGLLVGWCVQARPMCVPAGAVLAIVFLRGPIRKELALVAAAFLIAAAPWPTWVFLSTGSPYPIHTAADELSTLEGSARPGTPSATLHWLFVSRIFSPGNLGPAALALLVAVFFLQRPPAVNDLLLALTVALALQYVGTLKLGSHMLGGVFQGRYFSTTMIPVTCLIGAWTWDQLRIQIPFASRAVAFSLIVQFLPPLAASVRRAVWVSPCVVGRMPREQLLRNAVPYYELIENVNARVGPGESVVAALQDQAFLEVPYHYVDQHKQSWLSREDYLEIMRQDGARWLVLSEKVLQRVDPGPELIEVYRGPRGGLYRRK